jgi:hypothetical protein
MYVLYTSLILSIRDRLEISYMRNSNLELSDCPLFEVHLIYTTFRDLALLPSSSDWSTFIFCHETLRV